MVMTNLRKKTEYAVIHSSDTYADEDIGVDELTRLHRKDGFFKCKYHYIILRDGIIEAGRPIQEAGSHVSGDEINDQNSIAICLIGGKDKNDKPFFNYTGKQMKSLNKLVSDLKEMYKLDVVGYRDVSNNSSSPYFDYSQYVI